MIPGPVFLAVLVSFLCLRVGGLWFPVLDSASAWMIAAAGLAAAADAAFLLTRRRPELERLHPAVFILGRQSEVSLTLRGLPRLLRRADIFDGLPQNLETPELPLRVRFGPGQESATLRYRVRALERGDAPFSPAHVRVPSFLGFWTRTLRLGPAAASRVYPAYHLDEQESLALLAGAQNAGSPRSSRLRGHGWEFRQLREYQEGDPVRLVDWKATSRLRKLIVKELQEDQNQEIVFLLDTGYRMFARDGERSHFDRALEAILHLADTALRQGDQVGVACFGPDSRRLGPFKGASSLDALTAGLYDLDAQAAASSPAAALEALAGDLRRRSLIVLVSNLREEDSGGLGPRVSYALRRHLLLTLWMRESVIDEALTPPFRGLDEALAAAAARRSLDERARLQAVWRSQGVFVVDTPPASLSAALVNAYWDIKRDGRL